jgi:hypothetical protein
MSRRLRLRTGALTALTGLFLLAAFAGPAAATPPSAVDLSFDKTTGVLNISITHDSENIATHYIYKVEIKKNGAAYNTSMYTSQPDAHRFTYTYTVLAADGDTIEVTASCVLFGSLTTKLDVATGKTISSGGASYSLWPYHATMMVTGVVLSGLAVSAIYMKKKPWWFKGHRILGALGGGLMVTGVLTAAYMIAAAGGTQFRVPHAWLGISILILVLASLALGTTYVYFTKLKKTVRGPHLWLGRTIALLEIIEVFLGLVLVGILSLG